MSAPQLPESPKPPQAIPGAVKLALLTAAVGAGFAAPAHASFISTDTSGLITFTVTSPNQSFDINGDGTTDYTIGGNSTGVLIDGGTNRVSSFTVDASPFPSTSAFESPGSLKSSSGPVVIFGENAPLPPTEFTADMPGFLELLFDRNGGQGYIGYLEGTLTAPGTSIPDWTFTVDDYGYNPTPVSVPEPSSLALLAAGAAGLIALRRRRRRGTLAA
ncbi:MAG: PEP-CTERM sorting domain-containing protein [Steroidobacteraceae bacterium]